MKLKGKQKKIDVAKPFGNITGEDIAKFREYKKGSAFVAKNKEIKI